MMKPLRNFRRRLRSIGRPPSASFVAYRSLGSDTHLRIRGRILTEADKYEAKPEATRWQNFRAVLHQLLSDEVPFAKVEVSYRGVTVEGTSNEEGYVDVSWLSDSPLEPGWHYPEVRISELPINAVADGVRTAECLVPSAEAGHAVISDIDDTILRSDITDRSRMLAWTLFHNFHSREMLPGAAQLYTDIAAVSGPNPVFYVSNSPWNLYSTIRDFLDDRGFPKGPIFLRDFGIRGRDKSRNHKPATICSLLNGGLNARFILIGDAGEHDATYYADAIENHPDKVMAAYIREVESSRDRSGIDVASSRSLKHGVEMVAVDSSDEIRQHLAKRACFDSMSQSQVS